MSKPIYGDSVEKLNCVPESAAVTGLIAQTNFLLSSLTTTNKTSILAQLDNVRHQMMYIAGIGDTFQPFQSGTRDASSRGLEKRLVLTGGKLEVVSGSDS